MATCHHARHPGMPVPCAPTLVQRVIGLTVAQRGPVSCLGALPVGVDRNQVALVSDNIFIFHFYLNSIQFISTN